MSSAIYFRLFGQTVALIMHSVNSISMYIAMQDEELMKDPQIKTMTSLQSRYLTVWNVAFQITYFSIAFICDILTVSGRDHVLPKSIRRFRQLLFESIVWPATMVVFTIFWPFFLTDRELVFPEFIDKIFSFKNNLVIHFGIMVVAIWELKFWPRPEPRNHMKNLLPATILMAVYIIVLFHTYNQRGIWPYPIMDLTYKTIYFPVLIVAVYVIGILCYFVQWNLTPESQETFKRYNKK